MEGLLTPILVVYSMDAKLVAVLNIGILSESY